MQTLYIIILNKAYIHIMYIQWMQNSKNNFIILLITIKYVFYCLFYLKGITKKE